jgi:glucosamine kinase
VKVLDARHRNRSTALHHTIAERCGTTREDMLAWLWQAEPAQFAELAPMVLDCAGDGDTAAIAIVTAAGREIDALAEALDPGRQVPLALVGGLAEPLDPFLPDRLRNWVRAPKQEPLLGALMLAQGRAPDETIVWQNR